MPDKWSFLVCGMGYGISRLPLAMLILICQKATLLTKEWYMHPNGHLPAFYEWDFYRCQPPIHALACWVVYKMEKRKEQWKGRYHF